MHRSAPRQQLRGRSYWLVLPGWMWLVIFFVVPPLVMLSVSTMTGDIDNGFKQTFTWQQLHATPGRSTTCSSSARSSTA